MLRTLALRHDPDDLAQRDGPAVMQTVRDLTAGLGGVLGEQGTHQFLIALFARAEHFHSDEVRMVALLFHELVSGVPDKRKAAGHSGSEVGAGGAENQDGAAGHVFASVIADALDDGSCSRVADGKAFAGAADREERACGGSVERDVADDDLRRLGARQLAARANDELAARESFADESRWPGLRARASCLRRKRAERLPGGAAQAEVNVGLQLGLLRAQEC